MNNQFENKPDGGGKSLPTSTGTKIRLLLQVLVYVNQIVMIFSDLEFADNIVYQIVSVVLSLAITGLSYWYNNDWTGLAKLSSKVFDVLKDGKVTQEEIEELINEHTKE